MTKKFIYQVNTYEWVDTEAWGWAWREAKAKAAELRTPVYRTIIKNDEPQPLEVFVVGGCFLRVEYRREPYIF